MLVDLIVILWYNDIIKLYGGSMYILGIDPGLAIVGWGIVESHRGKVRPVAYGAITTPAHTDIEARLLMIQNDLEAIINKYHPEEMAVEELFFNTNITTGIAVAHARGVALLTCVKACGRLYEYTPMQIKQALTGYGRADKKQIQSVVTSLLHLNAVPKPDDAADALAIALCHGYSNRFGELFAVGNMTRTKGNNAAPASAYQELMASAAKSAKRTKSSQGFSSAQSASALQNATGIAGVTGVGRASVCRTVPPKAKTMGTGSSSLTKEKK